MASKCSKLRCFAKTLQVIVYFLNAFIWAVSILALICGFVIGISNDTVRVNTLEDIGVTTPATILIIYGCFLIIVTTFGCFSSITAKIIISIIYTLLIIAYICFDIFGGYLFSFSDESLIKFYTSVNTSLINYGNGNSKRVGIFPVSPEKYWDHLQARGKCCGLYSFEDWRKTNYSRKTFNIPDSCCNDDYNYRFCGVQIFRHPDSEHHSVGDLLHPTGCHQIFPEPLRFPPDYRITYVTRCVGCLLIVCGVLTCVILIMVVTKKFRTEQGIDNLDYVETPKVSDVDIMDGHAGGGEQGQRAFRTAKVHPEPQNADPNDNNDQDANKRVLFKESGPQFIHDRPHSEPEDIERNDRRNGGVINRRPQTAGTMQNYSNNNSGGRWGNQNILLS